MKPFASLLLALSLGMAVATGATAQDSAPQAEVAQADMSLGSIVAVDMYSETVTINHGPLDNLGMSAMTMSFKVRSRDMLSQVKAGDQVRFVADVLNNELTVVTLVVL